MINTTRPILNLDLDLLRTFVAVADLNTFAAAAAAVCRTQSAVSQQMQRLEQLGLLQAHGQGERTHWLLGALAQGQAARESLLSIVLFPLLTPLLLAGISVGAQALGAPSADGPGIWLGVAAAFDAVFLGAGLLLFGHIYAGDE